MVGRVDVEDPAATTPGSFAEGLGAQLGLWVRATHARVLDAQRGVAQEAGAFVVAEHHPEPEGRLVDRVPDAELPVLGVRVRRRIPSANGSNWGERARVSRVRRKRSE